MTIQVTPARYEEDDMRARFLHQGTVYALKVTDPQYKSRFRAKGVGNYRLGEAYVTVSLTESPHKGYFYKLAAAIVECSDQRSAIRR
ncbi:dual OB domain-containing protein [Amycolatopsis sp. NPDC051903]|uniref:dual OB domain-containing protein n=1 Tax=Amycolatopsis sp. NPDC051903 TaxID=3363936 RepID=UPI00379DCC3D